MTVPAGENNEWVVSSTESENGIAVYEQRSHEIAAETSDRCYPGMDGYSPAGIERCRSLEPGGHPLPV